MRLLFRGDHVDVVGDEELPYPGDRAAPAGDELRGAKVGGPRGVGQLRGEAFVLAGTDLYVGILLMQ